MAARGLVVVRTATVAIVSIATVASLAALVPATSSERHTPADRTRAWPPSPYEGSPLPAGLRVPDVTLRDERGRPVRLARLGRPAVVSFGSAVCEDVCPLETQLVRGALDDAGTDMPAYIVAVDPSRDTAKAARRFLTEQAVAGRMHFLLGPRAELERTWRGFAVAPERASAHHQARVVLTDDRGRQRAGTFVDQATSESLAHDMRVVADGPRVIDRTPSRPRSPSGGTRAP